MSELERLVIAVQDAVRASQRRRVWLLTPAFRKALADLMRYEVGHV